MTLLCVGLDHRATPMSVLADTALDAVGLRSLLLDVAADDVVAETMVVSTCNRLEVYADVDRFHPAVESVTSLIAKRTGFDRDRLVDHLRVRYDEAAVMHLMSVACGLESVVPGETQVLGQVRTALRQAQDEGTAGRRLNALVQSALRTGKRVHTETQVAAAGASVVSAGLDLVRDHVDGFAGRHAVVVGAGAMGVLAAATLRREDVATLTIVNRTVEHAERIAATHGGTAAGLDRLAELVGQADVVVTAVGSGRTLIDREWLAAARPLQAGPLAVIDLALPPDTAADCGSLPGVLRVDLATLHDAEATHPSTADLAAAHGIVRDEVAAHLASEAARSVEPTLIALREHAADVVAAELTRLRTRLSDLDAAQFDEVERALRRTVASLLHRPTVRIKEYAIGPEGGVYAEALRALFDLDPAVVDSLGNPRP
jgi:glutamyl-tRNA reductase